MTPNAFSPLGGIQEILLLVFVVMTLVGIAGGNPSSVLQPICRLAAQILTALLSLICSLLATTIQVVLPMIISGTRNLIGTIETANNNRRISK